MLTDILNRTALGRLIVLVVALTAIGAPNQRRRPVPIHCVRGQIARLTAQVASADPRLPEELRRVTRRIASLATALEAELRRFRPLEQRFEQAASHVQD